MGMTVRLFFCLFFPLLLQAQSKHEKQILDILDAQTKAWNSGDLDRFMIGYWESDSLMYIGKSGVTYGYQRTLDTYNKNYGSADKMGSLSFEVLHLNKLGSKHYLVVGKWFLVRNAGNTGGHYTLVFRRSKGRWVIISDHSS